MDTFILAENVIYFSLTTIMINSHSKLKCVDDIEFVNKKDTLEKYNTKRLKRKHIYHEQSAEFLELFCIAIVDKLTDYFMNHHLYQKSTFTQPKVYLCHFILKSNLRTNVDRNWENLRTANLNQNLLVLKKSVNCIQTDKCEWIKCKNQENIQRYR